MTNGIPRRDNKHGTLTENFTDCDHGGQDRRYSRIRIILENTE